MKKFFLFSLLTLLYFAGCQKENLNPVSSETRMEALGEENNTKLLNSAKELKRNGMTAEETTLSLFPDYTDRKVYIVKLLHSVGYKVDGILLLIKNLFRLNTDEAYELLVLALGDSFDEQYAEAILKIYKEELSKDFEKLKDYLKKISSIKNQLIILIDFYRISIKEATEILKDFSYSAIEISLIIKEQYNYDALQIASLLLDIDFNLDEIIDVLLNIYNKQRLEIIRILLSLNIDKCDIYRFFRIPCRSYS